MVRIKEELITPLQSLSRVCLSLHPSKPHLLQLYNLKSLEGLVISSTATRGLLLVQKSPWYRTGALSQPQLLLRTPSLSFLLGQLGCLIKLNQLPALREGLLYLHIFPEQTQIPVLDHQQHLVRGLPFLVSRTFSPLAGTISACLE